MPVPPNDSIVKQLHEAGAFIFPCGRFGDAKVPQGSWNPDSENKATRRKAAADKGKSGECTAESLDRWLKKDVPFGMIPGRCGIPLYVVDVDSVIVNGVQKRFGDGSKKQQQAAFAEIKSRIGGPLAACRSGGKSGGWHLFYKLHPQDGGYDPEDEASQGYTKGKFEPPHCGGEVICRNGYVVIWSPKTVLKALKKAENAAETRMAPLFDPVINATNGAELAWMQAAAGRTKQILQNKEDDVSITDDMRRFMLDYVQNDARYKLVGSEYKGPDPRNGNGHDRLKVDAESGSWLLRKSGGKDDEDDKKINRRLPLELGYAPPAPYKSAPVVSEGVLAVKMAKDRQKDLRWNTEQWLKYSEKDGRWTDGADCAHDTVWRIIRKYAPHPGYPPSALSEEEKDGMSKAALKTASNTLEAWRNAKTEHQRFNRAAVAKAVLSIAGQNRRIRAKPGDFDNNPHLVGLPDGKCWELDTGTVRTAAPEDMLTKSVAFNPVNGDYRTTLLYQKLSETLAVRYLEETDEIIAMILRMAGAALAIDKSRHEFLLLTGTPGGGKSALVIDFWLDVFGDYGSTISRKIADDRPGQHMEWVMPTEHYRLMANSDLPAGAFAADVLSRLVEDRPIEGNKMRENTRSFKAKASIWGACNAEPRGRGGLFRRIRPVRFRDEIKHKDEHLAAKLRDPQEAGIWLHAAVDAWRTLRFEPTKLPKMVQTDIRRYKEINSPLESFVRERLVLKPDDPAYAGEPAWWFVSAADMYADYKSYCETLDIKALGINKLKTELTAGSWRIDDCKESTGKRRRGYKNCFLVGKINAGNRNCYPPAPTDEINPNNADNETNPINEADWA